jgi:PAS domain S-box-containing protein
MPTFQGPSSPAAPPDRHAAYRRLVLAAARGASLAEIAHIGLSAACAVCGAPVGQLRVIDDRLAVPRRLRSVMAVGTTDRPLLAAALAGTGAETPPATATALATGHASRFPEDAKDTGAEATTHVLAVPVSHGDIVGVIELAGEQPPASDAATLDVLRDLAEVIGAVVAREQDSPSTDADPAVTPLERAVRERLEMDQQRLLAAEVIGSFGVWELVPGQQFVWSDQLRRIHGVAPDFIPTLDSNLALVHPDDLHIVFDHMSEMRADGPDGGTTPIQHRIVRPDGDVRWVETHVKVLEGARAIGITRDITEERSRRWRERLRSKIAQTITEGVVLVSPDDTVVFVSPQWAEMFGYEPEEMEGRCIWDFCLGDGDGPLKPLGEQTDGFQREIRHRHRDGTIFVTEANITPMPLEDSEPGELAWLAVERDITDEKAQSEARLLAEEALARYAADLERSNAELRRAKAEAEAANKAKNEFLSRMSHELRTPLNAVLGYAELLGMEEEELAETQLDMVHQVLRGGRHLLMLIDEVLDIARMENGTMTMFIEPVDVTAAIDHACSLLEPLVRERQVRVRTPRPDDDLPLVGADRQRVVQILLNLLSNAVKYNVFGGEVSVSVDSTEERVSLAVSDTGPGIAPEVLPRLFEPFDRLGAEQTDVEGTGIGLTVSRALAEQMGGRLTVRSTPGEGSTFTLELPLFSRATASPTT